MLYVASYNELEQLHMQVLLCVFQLCNPAVLCVFQVFIVVQPTVIISVLTTTHFLHPVVDVSAQSCTFTPLNPTTLTATGGALVIGTTDVRIWCVCPVTGDQRVRWYDINENFVNRDTHMDYVTGSPYYIPNSPNGATNVTLVIPTFNDLYDGTYNCGIRVSNTEFTSPSAAVTLTIGELMINTVSYLYVAT